MTRPPIGLCLPVEYVRCRDADTVEVRTRNSGRIWAIRLRDCWPPETRGKEREDGLAAKRYAEAILDASDVLHVFIPLDVERQNPLESLSFDRLVGDLWIDNTKRLADMLVDAGHATKEKHAK